jgi:opacity protein-like surface antigen
MNNKFLFALMAVTCAQVAVAKDYMGIGIETGTATYSGYEFVNPRITGVVQDNNTPSVTNLSLVYGRSYPEFRAELELNLGNRGVFTSYHSPFNTNEQIKEVSSNRVMVNLVKDLELGYKFKPYLVGGLGIAMNTAEGFQGPLRNAFEKKTSYSMAYSLGVGGQVKIAPQNSFDISYRYVNAGTADTGMSLFAPFDEQFKGKFVTSGLRLLFVRELK